MIIAIYPGTFDPVTNGHLDVLQRASKIFDQVIVAVSEDNSEKKTVFDCTTRVNLLSQNTDNLLNVAVEPFSGLLVDYAKRKKQVWLSAGCVLYQILNMNFKWLK